MSKRPLDRLSPEEARALWERALEMQLESARRRDERVLSTGEDSMDDAEDRWGFTPEEVAAAAREAGIAGEFMEVALAEREIARADGRGPQGRVDRAADRLLDNPRKVLEVSHTLHATPEQVLGVMQELFPKHPYFLTLRDVRGNDPLADGILVFKAPGWDVYMHHQTPFTRGMVYGDLDLLFITIRGARGGRSGSPGDGSDEAAGEGAGARAEPPARAGETARAEETASTQVVIRAPLRKSRRAQWWWAVGLGTPLTLGSGLAGVLLGASLGAALPPLLALAAAAIPGAVAAGGVGAGNVWAFRRLYDWGTGKAREALRQMLGAVDVSVRTGGGFQLPEWGQRGGKSNPTFPPFQR